MKDLREWLKNFCLNFGSPIVVILVILYTGIVLAKLIKQR